MILYSANNMGDLNRKNVLNNFFFNNESEIYLFYEKIV